MSLRERIAWRPARWQPARPPAPFDPVDAEYRARIEAKWAREKFLGDEVARQNFEARHPLADDGGFRLTLDPPAPEMPLTWLKIQSRITLNAQGGVVRSRALMVPAAAEGSQHFARYDLDPRMENYLVAAELPQGATAALIACVADLLSGAEGPAARWLGAARAQAPTREALSVLFEFSLDLRPNFKPPYALMQLVAPAPVGILASYRAGPYDEEVSTEAPYGEAIVSEPWCSTLASLAALYAEPVSTFATEAQAELATLEETLPRLLRGVR